MAFGTISPEWYWTQSLQGPWSADVLCLQWCQGWSLAQDTELLPHLMHPPGPGDAGCGGESKGRWHLSSGKPATKLAKHRRDADKQDPSQSYLQFSSSECWQKWKILASSPSVLPKLMAPAPLVLSPFSIKVLIHQWVCCQSFRPEFPCAYFFFALNRGKKRQSLFDIEA